MRRVTVLTRQPGASGAEPHRPLSAPGARVSIDLPHESDKARARFSREGLFPVSALAWTTSDAIPEVTDLGVFDVGPEFTVTEHVGWRPEAPEDAHPRDVVKQVSFLHATEGMPLAEFREHYRAHVGVARRYMPSLWQYVQNDVIKVSVNNEPLAAGVVAISELWFRTTDDFLHRYFASAEDETEFRSHEGFLDLPKAFSFVCSSHTLGNTTRS